MKFKRKPDQNEENEFSNYMEVRSIVGNITAFIDDVQSINEKIEILNYVKRELHEISPFKDEPVDCVTWEIAQNVFANDYNPNTVAPPEMELLEHSILEDGFTQPIVTWPTENGKEVIDGFHRNRVGKECENVKNRIHERLPVVAINTNRQDKGDRIAATIRHNRARGKHKIDSMSDIVRELKRRCWKDKKIAKELGMDADECVEACSNHRTC